jgi:hypothetical protein
MNANELADFVEISKPDDKAHQMIATMLRQQHAEIDSLRKNLDVALMMVDDLEKGLESSIYLNKAQAERHGNNEPVAWMSQGGDVSRSKDYFEEMGFKDLIPLYTQPSEHDLGIAEAIGFEKGYNTNKLDDLTKEEILCLWDWWNPEKGKVPNWFTRWMMKVCFSCTWVRKAQEK